MARDREVHTLSLTTFGKQCLNEGSPEMKIVKYVSSSNANRTELISLQELKDWIENKEISSVISSHTPSIVLLTKSNKGSLSTGVQPLLGINQALANKWICLIKNHDEQIVKNSTSTTRVKVNTTIGSEICDIIQQQLDILQNTQDNLNVLPVEVILPLRRRKMIKTKIRRNYRISKGTKFISNAWKEYIFGANSISTNDLSPFHQDLYRKSPENNDIDNSHGEETLA